MSQFTPADYKQAQDRGISKEELDAQWNLLEKGFPKTKLERAAQPGDGIRVLSAEEKEAFAGIYRSASGEYESYKFTPASGAASRMFQPFRDLIENGHFQGESTLVHKLDKFPFYPDILSKGGDMEKEALIRFALDKEGMDYDTLPKGLVTFFREGDKAWNAFQAHEAEAEVLGIESLHFTVADEYRDQIKNCFDNQEKVELSVQDKHTDYIARWGEEVLRDADGKLHFRPSGHGAILNNLNSMDADIIFIKNIDNIQIGEKNNTSIEVKEYLAGLAIDLKQKIDAAMLQLMEDPDCDLNEISAWIKSELDPNFEASSKKELINFLNRPLRIAGMVKNEGQPGGGPFWVKNQFGVNLQIIEGAQIDKEDPRQMKILEGSSHFNPVELVCMPKNYLGKKFDLLDFVDAEAGFLTNKKVFGKEVKIMERPGLWNGSMANWITLFVEIPSESFSPVKSILDLIRS